MRQLIIGTAGHVDHGKTSLIRALTGVDTDRLKEEQERGMSIDLGFAHIGLGNDFTAGIIDVPGHERFLKNMLAGVTGMDLVLLVIAADEGIMPQTQEHIEILEILDITNVVIVLSKADMVDDEWISLVTDEIRNEFKDTSISSAPIIPVDSISGRGINELWDSIITQCDIPLSKREQMPFRLPVDRVFVKPGFGAVVTGTVLSGSLSVGDTIMAIPQNINGKVRGIQAYGKATSSVSTGSRAAINISGIGHDELYRGCEIVEPGASVAASSIDLQLKLHKSAPKLIKDRDRVRLHIGTSEVIGRISILSGTGIEPGHIDFAQFRGESTFAVTRGDRFVMRTYSPQLTIGGGVVLGVNPTRHKRNDTKVIASLQRKLSGDPAVLVEDFLLANYLGAKVGELSREFKVPETDTTDILTELQNSDLVMQCSNGRWLHTVCWRRLVQKSGAILDSFHSSTPLKSIMPRELYRSQLVPRSNPKALDDCIITMQLSRHIEIRNNGVCKAGFNVELTADDNEQFTSILGLLKKSGLVGLDVSELSESLSVPIHHTHELIRYGEDQGQLIRISDSLFYPADVLTGFQATLHELFATDNEITISNVRDKTGLSRKHIMPLLEYTDKICVTQRVGDIRKLISLQRD